MFHLTAILLINLYTPPAMNDAAEALRAVRIATGGKAWSRAGAIASLGRKTSFGLVGRYRETDDLKSGHFRQNSDYGIFENAEGSDTGGRWRLDGSGAVHDLDSAEADATARTERYLARRGYLQDDRTTRARLLPPAPGSGKYVRVEVTPKGGRAATLWIRRSDARLDRVVIELSPAVEDIRYSNFRRVAGVLLPFRFVIDYADDDESGAVEIATYRILPDVPARTMERPRPRNDVTFVDGTTATTVPAHVDSASGFLLIDASLDGTAASPFILDTGGHDILTPREARRRKLRLAGSGKSQGAGPGSTLTRFTRVRSVAIGAARLGSQPFTVLSLDLGRTRDKWGRSVPIAGILGLEIFERLAVTIAKHQISLAENAGDRFACRAIPLRFTRDMPLAMASVNGVDGVFGIDTGNNIDPIVFAHFLLAHAIKVKTVASASVNSSSVGGSLALMHARIGRLRLGTALFKDLPVEVSSMRAGSLATRSEAGNIGMSLLGRLSGVTFDYRHHRMCLSPHT